MQIDNLMITLMHEYGILKSSKSGFTSPGQISPPRSAGMPQFHRQPPPQPIQTKQASNHIASDQGDKTRSTVNADLEQKCRQLQKQNSELRAKLFQVETQRRRHKENLELELLRDKVGVFQKTFKEEEQYVNQLKEMLSQKQVQVKELVHSYQQKLETLQRKLDDQASSEYVNSLTQVIQDLNGLLKKQESIMVELLQRNKSLQDELSSYQKHRPRLRTANQWHPRIEQSYEQQDVHH